MPQAKTHSALKLPDGYYDALTKIGRMFWQHQKARKTINSQISALVKDGYPESWLEGLRAAAAAIKHQEKAREKELLKLVARHPLASWIDGVFGVGRGGFGRLLACTGPLNLFDTVSKLWAFLGQHVVNGLAPKRVKGQYSNWSSQGRTVCWQLATAIVRAHDGEYFRLYEKKRAEYLSRPRLGPSGCPFGQVHRGKERRPDAQGRKRQTGASRIIVCVKRNEDGSEPSAHVHAAAMRYSIKGFLKDLWCEWRRVMRPNC